MRATTSDPWRRDPTFEDARPRSVPRRSTFNGHPFGASVTPAYWDGVRGRGQAAGCRSTLRLNQGSVALERCVRRPLDATSSNVLAARQISHCRSSALRHRARGQPVGVELHRRAPDDCLAPERSQRRPLRTRLGPAGCSRAPRCSRRTSLVRWRAGIRYTGCRCDNGDGR